MNTEEAGLIQRLEVEMSREVDPLMVDLSFKLLDNTPVASCTVEELMTPGADAPDSPFVFQKITQRIVFTFLGFIVTGIACAVTSTVIKTLFG